VQNGFTRMPPLGSSELDAGAIALLTEWINTALPAQPTYDAWRIANFGNNTSPEGAETFDADADGQTNAHEFLAATAPQNSASFFTPQLATPGANFSLTATLPANRSFQIETSLDLQTWSIWDVPGNAGLPTSGSPITITGPRLFDAQFFRFLLREN
jgi:hypothetical protein